MSEIIFLAQLFRQLNNGKSPVPFNFTKSEATGGEGQPSGI